MNASAALTIKIAFLGAVSFWAPDIAVHAIRRNLFGRSEVLGLTLAMPLILLVCWVAVAKYFSMTAKAAAIRMLLGIWLLGDLCMVVGASFSGGGFAGPDGIPGAVKIIGISLLPMYTFIMATYDGSLGALLVITAILLIAWLLPTTRLKIRPQTQV